METLDLQDENGEIISFELYFTFFINDEEYYAFLPLDEEGIEFINVEFDDPDNDLSGFVVFRLDHDPVSGGEILVEIVDPVELEIVQDTALEMVPEN